MKQIMKALSLVVFIPLISACGTVDLDEVSSMEIRNWPFAKALHQEYVELAYAEAGESDWKDANYFGNKALDVATADFDLPGPQAVEEREIPTDALDDIKVAYHSLNEALEDGRRIKPQAAARAQAMFDCWMQEQEENFQPEDIAACNKAFRIAMSSLKIKPMAAAAIAPAPEPAEEPAPVTEAMKSVGPFMIFFDHNSATLDSAANDLVKTLARHKYAQDDEGYIVLSGHTDRSGSSSYNDALSEKRTMTISEMLMELGVKARILTTYYGEDRPVDSTQDGVKSAKNRRVEITLSR